jgi:outer membrane protein, heavy metal efflux system
MVRRAIEATLMIFMLTAAVAAQQPVPDSLRLEQVMRDVIHHNDRLAAMKYMEAAAMAKARSTGAWDDPMLMIGVINVPTNFDFKMDPMTMKMLGLSQNIPYAGQKGLQKKSAQADAAAATQDLHSEQLALASAAASAYYDLYFNLQALDLVMKQIEVAQNVVSSVQSRIATSQSNPEDVYAAQADLWRLQTQLTPTAHLVDNARYNLNVLRGLPADTPVASPAFPQLMTIPQTPDPWIAAAREHYPPLQKLSEQAKSYSYSAGAARRMQWPMLSLAGSYGIRKSTEMEMRDNMFSLQANISLPIFSGKQQRAMGQSMDLMRQSADAEAVQLGREVEIKIRALHLDALHFQENAAIYRQRIIPADEDAYQNAYSGYINNRATLATLLNYALTMFRDRSTAVQIDSDLAKTLAEVGKYITDPAQYGGPEYLKNSEAKDR